MPTARGFYNNSPSGAALIVKDEGITVASAATSMDFVGAGVAVTAVGQAVTVTVSASSVTVGTTVFTGGTTGSVLFIGASSVVQQDNANFFWDDTNNRLGIRTATPAYALDVFGIIKTEYAVVGTELGPYVGTFHRMQIVATGTQTPLMIQGGGGIVEVWMDTSPTRAGAFGLAVPGNAVGEDFVFSLFYSGGGNWTEKLRIQQLTGFIGINQASPTAMLHVTPTAKTGASGLTRGSLQIDSFTYTDNATAASGTATSFAFNSIHQPTLAATNSSVTTTAAATWYIANAPAAGSNMTITNPYSLWIDAGNSRLDGNLMLGTSVAGASAANGVLALGNGATAPSTSVDLVQLYAVDLSAGNATLGIYTETAVAADVAVASTNSLTVKINGTNYKILLST